MFKLVYTTMKKIYQNPSLVVLDVKLEGILCQVSGSVDQNSMTKENEETMGVKSQRNNNYKGNPVVWEDWQ